MNILPGQFPVPIFNSTPDTFKLVADTLTADTVPAGVALADTARVDSVASDSLQAVAAHADTIPSIFDGPRLGMAADPAPYFSGADDLLAALTMAALLASLIALAFSGKFIARQVKNFFYLGNDRTTPVPDTPGELSGQGVLVAGTCLVVAIAFYCHIIHGRDDGWWVFSKHGVLGICALSVVAYFLFKAVAYQFVNWVFFDVKKWRVWP